MVECDDCFEPLPAAEAWRVASVEAAEDGGPGGTAMVAEFHEDCAPEGATPPASLT